MKQFCGKVGSWAMTHQKASCVLCLSLLGCISVCGVGRNTVIIFLLIVRYMMHLFTIGINSLKSMVPTICQMAGLKTRYYSFHVTAAIRMFCSGMPKNFKAIAEVTGPRSMKALRQYEKTSRSGCRHGYSEL